jgi:hypothetical protein
MIEYLNTIAAQGSFPETDPVEYAHPPATASGEIVGIRFRSPAWPKIAAIQRRIFAAILAESRKMARYRPASGMSE